MSALSKTRVAVIRGGRPETFEWSLKNGEEVLSILRKDEDTMEPIDILVSPDGTWHLRGLPVEPHQPLALADRVWNVLSPGDHSVERLMERFRLDNACPSPLASALTGNVVQTRKLYARECIPTLRSAVLKREGVSHEDLIYIFRNYLHPLRVRPERPRAGAFDKVVTTFAELETAVADAFKGVEHVIAEEVVKGKEIITHVIKNARGQKYHALLSVEVKKNGYACPSSLTSAEKGLVEEYAKRAHAAFGLEGYSFTRAIVTPKGKVYVIETGAIPDLTSASSLPKALKATGWQTRDFVYHLLG